VILTKEEWIIPNVTLDKKINKELCSICFHSFEEHPPVRHKTDYKGNKMCFQCQMDKRTLLID